MNIPDALMLTGYLYGLLTASIVALVIWVCPAIKKALTGAATPIEGRQKNSTSVYQTERRLSRREST